MHIIVLSFLFVVFQCLFIIISGQYERSSGMTLLSLIMAGSMLVSAFISRKEALRGEANSNKATWVLLGYFSVLLMVSLFLWPIAPKDVIVQFLLFFVLGGLMLLPPGVERVWDFDKVLLFTSSLGLVGVIYCYLTGGYDLATYSGRSELAESRPMLVMGLTAGALYLSLKNADKLNFYFVVAFMIQTISSAVFASTGSRTALLIYSMNLICVLYLILTGAKKSVARTAILLLILSTISMSLVWIFMNFDLDLAMKRSAATFDTTIRGGGVLNDGRILEFTANRELFFNLRALPGYGFGSIWYDNSGIYRNEMPYRTLFHLGVLQCVFKIGIVGSLVWAYAYYSRIKRYGIYISKAYVCYAIMTFSALLFYGPNKLTVVYIIEFFILYNPALFVSRGRGRLFLRS